MKPGKMAHQIKLLDIKADNLTSTPRAHTVEKTN